jgi:hypothetical protein
VPSFEYEIDSPYEPAKFAPEFMPTLATILSQGGYSATTQTDWSATFTRRYSPALFIVLYILFFPIGLLLLLARPNQNVTISWQAADEGTLARVQGDDKRLVKLFDPMENSRRVA